MERKALEEEEVFVAYHSHCFPRMMYYQRPAQVVFPGDNNGGGHKVKRSKTAGRRRKPDPYADDFDQPYEAATAGAMYQGRHVILDESAQRYIPPGYL